MRVIRKAFASIGSASGSASGGTSEGRNRLLLVAHPDHPKAGVQMPAGTMEPGEAPEDAALREAREEAGLAGLVIAGLLGRHSFD
ncbi:MAG: NUDIX domain-containing protein [Thermomicrobiales bacterium]